MTFSDHFKNSLKAIGAAVVLLLVGYSCMRRNANRQEHSIPLKPGVTEEISFSGNQVRVTTSKGTTTQYARGGKVDVLASGKVVVRSDRFGFEHALFVGLGYGDGTTRLHLGVAFAYAWKFDLNAQVALSMDGSRRLLDFPVSASYNFWRNTSVFVGADPLPLLVGLPVAPHVGVLVKF